MGKIYHDQFGLYHYFIRLFVNYFVADYIKKRYTKNCYYKIARNIPSYNQDVKFE